VTVGHEGVEQGFKRWKLGNELLNDLAKGLEDGVVVDGRHVKAYRSVLIAVVTQVVCDTLDDVAIGVLAELVGEAVDFVNKHLDVDVRVRLLEVENSTSQTRNGLVVIVLGINNPDESADFAKDGIEIVHRIQKIKLSRKVPNLKIHERAAQACQIKFRYVNKS